MSNYIIKKVLNNNVVVAKKNTEEVILIGKAIGFDLKKGYEVPKNRIENMFIKASSESEENYEKILKIIDRKIVGISEEIISLCEKELNVKLNDALHVSLPDHINFAIRRIRKGIQMRNPFLHELIALYPKEYDLASKAVSMINERFNVYLPNDEIGFICLHINAAINSDNVSNPLTYTKKIGEIMALIGELLKKKLDKNGLEYARTITHIKFTLERITQKKTIKNYLLDSIKQQLCNEYTAAIKVSIKIESLFSVHVPEDEIGYIALHLKRLSEI
ncbi:PRD domain-containing protein [Haloimpatiens sp. FM7330]|uniref:PRD domain-containing protein n=1 Tax=Haloimpatiens sp. FM7330 TaxID=3298610 RepID=UPI0036386D8E